MKFNLLFTLVIAAICVVFSCTDLEKPDAPITIKPVADFKIKNTDFTAPVDVTVENTSTNTTSNTTYEWDFGNGQTSTEKNPPPSKYSLMNSYKIKLTVKDGANSDTKEQMISVVDPNQPVRACFTFTPNIALTAPSTVSFDASCSTPGVTYKWEFGVTSTVSTTIVNPSNVLYSTAAKYPVKLTVSKNGVTDDSTIVLDIKTPAPPVAAFSYNPCNTDFPTACDVSFTDKSTGTISKWTWDFGDPSSGASNTSSFTTPTNPSHKYSVAGTYTVKLTVEGPGGISPPQTQTIMLKYSTFEKTLTTVDEKGSSIIQTSDGGYFYTTKTEKGIGYGKLDKTGTLTWNDFYDEGTKPVTTLSPLFRTRGVETSDKGYIIAGTVANSTNNGKVVVIKLDANGKRVWNKELGDYIASGTKNTDYFYDLIKTPTNSYIVYMFDYRGSTATNTQTYRTVIVNESGNLQYSIDSKEGNSLSPIANIFQASDGNLVLSSVNRFIHKYSNTTLAVKNETLPNETINSISQSSKGPILALTSSKLHKLTLGSLVLENTIANRGGNCIIKNSQNDLVICGNEPARVIEKVDDDFKSKWVISASELNKTGVDFSFIRETTDGGYILIGTLANKTQILKVGPDGKL